MEIVEGIKLALEYTKNNEYKKAENLYLELLAKSPKNDSVLSFLGLFYYNIKKYNKAEKYLDDAYNISKSDTLVFYLGMSKYYIGKYQTAIPYFEKLIKDNKSLDLYKCIIKCYTNSKYYEPALQYSMDAHEKYPFDVEILEQIPFLLIKRGEFKKSEEFSLKLLKMDSKNSSGWHALGLLNEVLYHNEQKARECYTNMIKCGDKSNGYLDLAISYSKDSLTRKKAYYYLKKLEKSYPNTKGLNFLMASYYLSRRQFKKGYKYYVMREFNTKENYDWYRQLYPFWLGETNLEKDVLFVYGDQGIGDQIQYIRYLPYLLKRFKNLKVMVDKPIIELFKYSYRNQSNIDFLIDAKEIPKRDKSTFLSFSPYYLGMRFNNIPSSSGYLDVPLDKIESYKKKYFNTVKTKIGICWEAGATGLREQIHRVLNVELFEDIINSDNYSLYSFQVEPSLKNYKKYLNLIDLGLTFKDFLDTAAALKNLDIMITVDTSVAHLAGALGVKTILILPYCPDWRWFDNDKKTEWYDSVIIFKQQSNELWESVFDRIKTYLDNSI